MQHSQREWHGEFTPFWNNRGGFRGRGGGRFDRGSNFNRRGKNRDGGFFRGNYRGQRGRGGYQGGGLSRSERIKSDLPLKVGKKLSETDICVTEYANELPGFNGIIKSRFSDFQVSEISISGEIAKLTTLKAPSPMSTVPKIESDEDLLTYKYNLELLPLDVWNRINKLLMTSVKDAKEVEIDVTGMTKEHRTKIHEAVKFAFGDGIIGRTSDLMDKKFVIFDKPRKGVRIDKRVKWPYPAQYVHFILYKENCDTMEAINKLCASMKKKGINIYQMKPNMVGFCGTKDRRAKTTQWMSVTKVDPRKIDYASRGFREFRVGNYKFEDHPLSLGDLKGNRFRIVLRNVNTDSEVVLAACEQVSKSGFINYYGLQRFGSRPSAPTHVVGAALLTKDFNKALSLILEPAPGRLEEALLEYANTGYAQAALNLLPPHLIYSTIEGKILQALAHKPTNLMGATDTLPRNMRLLYIHSYQSYVWNNVASHRVCSDGLKPVVGDLVFDTDDITSKDIKFQETISDGLENADIEDPNDDDDDDQEDDDETEKESEHEEKCDQNEEKSEQQEKNSKQQVEKSEQQVEKSKQQVEKSEQQEEKSEQPVVKSEQQVVNSEQCEEKSMQKNEKDIGDAKSANNSDKPKSKKKKKKQAKIQPRVKILTQEDIDSGKYSIFDVILPLPGYNVRYPPNLVHYYTELMAKDNLTLGLKHRSKKLSLSGSYRPLMAIPENMTYELVKYNDPFADLLLSDLDELNGTNNLGIVKDGIYTALILHFSLPSSCYATMALRELLKANTGADTQAAQNSYHEAKTKTENEKKQETDENKQETNENKPETDENKPETDENKPETDGEKMDTEVDTKKRKADDAQDEDSKRVKTDNLKESEKKNPENEPN